MANNPYVNKVVFGSATLVDLTGTTATADKILQGYGAFGADGAWMDGTATQGGGTGGNVWQDAQGYVHLDDEGSGGGGSSWNLLASEELTISTDSTTSTSQGTVQLPNLLSSNEVLWVHIRDKAGKRNGYFYGSDSIWFFTNDTRPTNANPPTYAITSIDDAYKTSNGQYGVYAYNINASLQVVIRSKYNETNSGTIDGTYKCDIYKLSGLTLFE